MAKSTGKRGHRSKAEDVLSRKATQHHDFVGEAEPDRTRSRAVEQGRIRRDQEDLEKEVVKEMAHDLESMAGAEEKPASAAASAESAPSSVERPLFERPRSLREAVKLVRKMNEGNEAIDRQCIHIGRVLQQSGFHELAHAFLAEPFDVHRAAAGPVHQALHPLRRAVDVHAMVVRLALDAHERLTALGTLRGEFPRLGPGRTLRERPVDRSPWSAFPRNRHPYRESTRESARPSNRSRTRKGRRH